MRNLLTFLLAIFPVVCSAAIEKGSVEAVEVVGEAFLVEPSGKRTPLAKGEVFKEGCRIETSADSQANLAFSNGAKVRVLPASLVEVKAFTQVAHPDATPSRAGELKKEPSVSIVRLEVYRGKVTGEAAGLNASSSFTIKTPAGTTQIR